MFDESVGVDCVGAVTCSINMRIHRCTGSLVFSIVTCSAWPPYINSSCRERIESLYRIFRHSFRAVPIESAVRNAGFMSLSDFDGRRFDLVHNPDWPIEEAVERNVRHVFVDTLWLPEVIQYDATLKSASWGALHDRLLDVVDMIKLKVRANE